MSKLRAAILLLLAILYVVMGTVILNAKNLWDLPKIAQVSFGGLCIVYGIYRLYRAYQEFIAKEEIDEDSDV